jgi:hypothetical protein
VVDRERLRFRKEGSVTKAATPAPPPYIELDTSTHTYFVDGERVELSVTKVLKICGLIDDRWYTEYGRWRGSAVHKATHYFDEGDIDRRTLDPVVKPFVADWKDFREKTGFIPTLIEKPFYDGRYNFCGTPDRRGYFSAWQKAEEANTLVDIKAYPSGQAPNWARYQLAGLGWLIDPKRIFHRFAVVLTGNGAKVESYATEDYISDVNEFLAMVVVARAKQKLNQGGINE